MGAYKACPPFPSCELLVGGKPGGRAGWVRKSSAHLGDKRPDNPGVPRPAPPARDAAAGRAGRRFPAAFTGSAALLSAPGASSDPEEGSRGWQRGAPSGAWGLGAAAAPRPRGRRCRRRWMAACPRPATRRPPARLLLTAGRRREGGEKDKNGKS